MYVLILILDTKDEYITIISVGITVAIVAVLLTATIVICYLVKKKGKLVKEIRVLETQKSEASLRFVSVRLNCISYVIHITLGMFVIQVSSLYLGAALILKVCVIHKTNQIKYISYSCQLLLQ